MTLCIVLVTVATFSLAASAFGDIEQIIKELSGEVQAPQRNAAELREAYAQALDHLIPVISDETVEDRFGLQLVLQNIGSHASQPGAEVERAALCEVMGRRLSVSAPKPARVWIVRQLEHIGGAESVPALTKLLSDEDAQLREVARRALEKNPAPTASKALRAKLVKVNDPRWRIGLINSLGQRHDVDSVRMLRKLLDDAEPCVAMAAAASLAEISTKRAVKSLRRAHRRKTGVVRQRITDALFDAGVVRIKRGENAKAAKLYHKLYRSEEPVAVRAAALGGLAMCKPDKSVKLVIKAVRSSEPKMQAAAVQAARGISDTSLTRSLVAMMPDLASMAQLQVLGLAADCEDAQLRAKAAQAAIVLADNLVAPDLNAANSLAIQIKDMNISAEMNKRADEVIKKSREKGA